MSVRGAHRFSLVEQPGVPRPEVDGPVARGHGGLDDVAVVEEVGVVFLGGEQGLQFHLLPPGGEGGADRGAGEDEVAGVEPLEAAQRLEGLDRRVEHVASDGHVLAELLR